MGSRGRLALTVVAALMLSASARAALPQQSGAVDLLTQANVRIDGPAPAASASEGLAAAGDVNGDGIGDVIIGTPGTTGSAYVVFGQPALTGVDLAAPGARGFRIDGPGGNDGVGSAVGAAGMSTATASPMSSSARRASTPSPEPPTSSSARRRPARSASPPWAPEGSASTALR